ncbi:MAG: hypothetical protein Q8K32_03650 [Archangium sp.]|nr:hypothetical protein [Archangium sp.]
MKKLLVMAVISAALACIEWPDEEVIRARRCSVAPDDLGCPDQVDSGVADAGTVDAGGVDSGVDAGLDAGTDAGTDAGMDPPLQTGPWTLHWRDVSQDEAHFLVGGGAGGTLVGYRADAGLMTLLSLNGTAPVTQATTIPGARPTSAYERDERLAIGLADGTIRVELHQPPAYSPLTSRDAGFVTTAIDLFPDMASLSVAAYGELDGGLAVRSFYASGTQTGDQGVDVPCTTTLMRPQRILPMPDAGPGVVVGTVVGSCGLPLSFTGAAGGFVGFFGAPGPNSGFTFNAPVDSPMVLGLINDQMTLAYRPVNGQLALATLMRNSAPGTPRTILRGTLIPVDIVDLGAGGFALVGWGRGNISIIDGGSPFVADGQDVFIARLDQNRDVTELVVFGGRGDQTAVGAAVLEDRLIIGGSCGADSASGLCLDAGTGWSWVAGFSR